MVVWPSNSPTLIDLLEETTEKLEHFEDEHEEEDLDAESDHGLPSYNED